MADSTDRYVSMDQAAANSECSSRSSQIFVNCPKCDGRVGLHCDRCKIQITGCMCTEIDRFGTEAEGIAQIYDRLAQRVGDEAAREQLKKAGLWIPKGVELN